MDSWVVRVGTEGRDGLGGGGGAGAARHALTWTS